MDKEKKEAVENALRDERGKFESNVTKHDFESRLDNYQSQQQFKANFMSGPEADKSKLPEIDSNFGQGSNDYRYEKLLNDIDNYIGELSSEIEKEKKYMRTQSLNSDESSEIYKKYKQSKELMDSLNEFKQNFEEAANWIDREIYHSKDAGSPVINDPHSFDVNELTEEYLPKHEKAPELGDLESESEISFSDDGVEPISPSSSESKRTEAKVDSDNELDPFKTISENAGIELDEINNSVKRIGENSKSQTKIPNIFSGENEPSTKTISEQASQVLDLAKNEADLQGLENFRDSLADLQLNINNKLKESPEAREGLEKELKPYFDKTKELAKNNGLEVAGDRVDKSKHEFIEREIDAATVAKDGEKLGSELEGSFHKKLSDFDTVMEKHNPIKTDLEKIDKLSKKVGENSERFNNQEIAKQNQRDIAKEVQETIGSIKGEVNTQVSKGLVNKELDNLDNKLDKGAKNEIGFAELKKANQVNTKDKLAEKVDAAREAANDKNSSLKKSDKQAIEKSLGKIEKAAGLNQGKGRGVS